MGDFCGVHKSTAHRIIKKVTTSIAGLRRHIIKMPATPREIDKAKEAFYAIARFPKVVGCIDCTHIKIQSPGGNEAERFRNRKGFFSVNVQACCDADMSITNLVARWPGSTHDQNIFSHSRLKGLLENDDLRGGIILGDSGYALKKYLLTPIRNPMGNYHKEYNKCHTKTRNVIERMFGIWKRRFPVLSIGLRLSLDMALRVIVACGVLHNLAILSNEDIPPIEIVHEIEAIDVEDDGNGNIRQPYIHHINNLI
ncbi:putative nuclease HARBI1 [Ischnura elegans]|uniref:putative nuclease HARBI1 n=1 Tax=Ischnura elegans TaxID=197161 RepID=UPI001ED880A7|nr:putative nuclease HARBI1 [Ischnura elegans]